MNTRLLLLAGFLTLAAVPASADLITGTVVDSLGNPVQGVNLDVLALSGPDPDPMDDSTALDGTFATTIPAGVYQVLFKPPVPPGSTHLPVELDNVVVVGTVNLGTIVLPAGVAISGRVVSPTGIPVGDADIDATDPVTGENVLLANDNVDLFGNFSLAVPADLILQIEPRPPLAGPLYAPREFAFALTGDTNLGDLVLQPGFEITGTVVGPGGVPVPQADFDVVDLATGIDLFTPGDNTSAAGTFRLVVPAGTYDFELCPQNASRLVAVQAKNVTVNANVNVGTIPLQAGFLMSGTVTDCMGRPLADVDVDVLRASNLSAVFLCLDRTDELGQYAVVVPPIPLIGVFTRPGFGVEVNTGLLPVADFVLNGDLDCCAPGSATVRNGTGTNPLLFQSSNAPGIGDAWNVTVDTTGRPAGALAIVGYAAPGSGILLPASGEVLFNPASPRLFLAVQPHGGAPTPLSFPIPNSVELCGAFAATQALVFGGPDPIFTNALDLVIGE